MFPVARILTVHSFVTISDGFHQLSIYIFLPQPRKTKMMSITYDDETLSKESEKRGLSTSGKLQLTLHTP